MIGVLTRTRDLWLDLRYTFYAYSTGLFFPIQVIGGKLSYDIASCWREPDADTHFFLRPYVSGSVTYYHLLADSLKTIDGTSDLVVGKVGLGFTF
jgi:hypothetical protein